MIAIGWICFGYVEECVQPPQFGGGSSWWWGMMGVHTPDLRTGLLERETHQESMEWSRMEPWLSVALPLPPSSLNSSRYVLKIFKIVQSLNVFFYLSIFCDQPLWMYWHPLGISLIPSTTCSIRHCVFSYFALLHLLQMGLSAEGSSFGASWCFNVLHKCPHNLL